MLREWRWLIRVVKRAAPFGSAPVMNFEGCGGGVVVVFAAMSGGG